ncbi:MAG: histidine kinase dimerization/phospho-acceptor domain-containing protein [Ferruginibacter sp.]
MKESKIAELGMIDILYEIKNPLTNIRLALEFLEAGVVSSETQGFYDIIKNSAVKIESSVRDLCNSYHDLGMTLHLPPDTKELE